MGCVPILSITTSRQLPDPRPHARHPHGTRRMAHKIRNIYPPKYDVDELITLASGASFLFRVNYVDGHIRAEFNEDTSSLKARIGKVQRPGKPAIRRKD